MNIDTLKPITTTERAKELGRKGGIASGISRRKQKKTREIFKFANIDSLIGFAKLVDNLNKDDYDTQNTQY